MKKISYLLLVLLFSAAFQSCSDDDENAYAEWQQENEEYINDIKDDPAYLQASVPQGPGTVYYQIDPLKSGNGTFPIYTSKVKVRYKGSLIDGTVFDDASDRTVELSVNGVVSGFAVALQNMQVGEKWTVYIPWQLGYGSSGTSSGTIPPYSTLIFEIELMEISQY